MAFFDRLKEGRINAGLTQEQLAEKLGIAKSTLSGYESGNREPTVATIAKAMDILKIDANYLYQDEMDALGGNPMQLKYSEMQYIKKYRDLDDHGQAIVNMVLKEEYSRCKKENTPTEDTSKKMTEFPRQITKAAHARTDIEHTPEGKAHDDALMENDEYWK